MTPLSDRRGAPRTPGLADNAFGPPALFALGVAMSVIAALLLGAYLLGVSWRWPYPQDHETYVFGRDFFNFWAYGRAAFLDNPGRFYDIAAYGRFMEETLGPGYWPQQWSYPPSVMLIAAPFALLPYPLAYALWMGSGVALFLFAVLYRAENPRWIPVLLLSPAALACLISGQHAFHVAAILVGVYRLMDRRPVAAGVLLGLLTLKPQLGLLFPLMLAVSRRWTVFATAAAAALALVLATAILFGPDVWSAYVSVGIPAQNAVVLREPARLIASLMPSVFMDGWRAGLSYEASMALQLVAAAVAALAVAIVYRKPREPLLSYAALLAAALLATPYVLSYDLVFAGFLAVAAMRSPHFGATGRLLTLLLYMLPAIGLALGAADIPLVSLVPALFLAWLLRALLADSVRPDASQAVDPRGQ